MATSKSRLFTAMLVLACLGACGQKGALYLPENEPPPVQTSQPCRTTSCIESQGEEKEEDKPTVEQATDTNENTE